MQYKGKFVHDGNEYVIEIAKNLTTTRTDLYCIETVTEDNDTDDVFTKLFFSTKDVEVKTLISSVLERTTDTKTYVCGTNTLNQKVKLFESMFKYRKHLKENILVDSMDFEDGQFVRTFHAKSDDYELIEKFHANNDLIYRLAKISDSNYIEYTKSSDQKAVTFLKGYEERYTEYTISTEDIEHFKVNQNIRSMSEIRGIKNLDWQCDKNYTVVETQEEFDKFMDTIQALPLDWIIAFDTETSGLRFNRFPEGHRQRDYVTGYVFSWAEDQAIYIPVNHKVIANIEHGHVLKRLKPILEKRHIVTHNGIFDTKVMLSYGIKLNMCDDTYILERLLTSDDIANKASLKFLVGKYFKDKFGMDIEQLSLKDIFGSKKTDNIAFQWLPKEHVLAYAPADADFTRQIYFLLRNLIPNDAEAMYGQEVECMKNLASVEFYGYKVDTEKMYDLYAKALRDLSVLEESIYKFAGYKFNIKSVDQVYKLLYDEMGCPKVVKMKDNPDRAACNIKAFKYLSNLKGNGVKRYTHILSNYQYEIKKGKDSYTNEKGDTYKILINEGILNKSKYPIAALLTAYKKLAKDIDALYKSIDSKIKFNDENYMFSEYSSLKAATHRIISSNINFQQIPKYHKDLIIPYSDDYICYNTDYNSVELRLMVSIFKDARMMKKMFNPDNDIHRTIVGEIKHVEPHTVTDAERSEGKKYNFGVPYDMGGYAFAELLYGQPVTKDNIDKALREKENYLNNLPRVRDGFNEVRDKAEKTGYAKTAFNSYLWLPELKAECEKAEPDKQVVERLRRRAGNFPIQGLAADIFKCAFNRLMRRFKKDNIDAHIVGLIHDEFLIFVHKKHHPYDIIRIMKECMEMQIPNFAPLFTGIAVANNWGETKNGPYELPVQLADEMAQASRDGNLPKIEGSYRDFLYDRKIDYLKKRFRDELTDLHFNWVEPATNHLGTILNDMKNMFIGVEIREMYPTPADTIASSYVEFIKEVANVDLSSTIEITDTIKSEKAENIIDISEYLTENSDILHDLYEDDDEDDEEDGGSYVDFTEYAHIMKETQKNVESNKGYNYILDKDLYIDISNITREGLEAIKSYLISINEADGYYGVKLVLYADIIQTPFKIDCIDRDTLDGIILAHKACITA